MSYQTNEKPPPKWAWFWSRDPFKFLVPPKISRKSLKRETSNFVHWFGGSTYNVLALRLQSVPLVGVVTVVCIFKFTK